MIRLTFITAYPLSTPTPLHVSCSPSSIIFFVSCSPLSMFIPQWKHKRVSKLGFFFFFASDIRRHYGPTCPMYLHRGGFSTHVSCFHCMSLDRESTNRLEPQNDIFPRAPYVPLSNTCKVFTCQGIGSFHQRWQDLYRPDSIDVYFGKFRSTGKLPCGLPWRVQARRKKWAPCWYASTL